MCGIAGIIGSADVQVMERMLEVIAHRGPDGCGIKPFEHTPPFSSAILGHRRLAVIDLSERGLQPMCNEDGSIWVVYNGEIYNFKAIRRELETAGHVFKSKTDTEVLIHGYEQWGAALVERLNGMFAFGIWDCSAGELLLVRDRLGIKPLYYSRVGSDFAFASEIKALLEVPNIQRKVCVEAFGAYLGLGYIPGPLTMFEGIVKLQPGHMLSLKNGEATIRKYWEIPYGRQLEGDLQTHAGQLRDLIAEAVDMRTISDVPLGTFLSGGIDSSVITALVAQRTGLGGSLESYCVNYSDEKSRHNEQTYAELVASDLGIRCHMATCTGQYSQEVLPRLIWHLDEPLAEDLLPPYAHLCRQARENLTVVLSGDGPDEFLFGYRYYVLEALRRKVVAIPAFLRSGIRAAIRSMSSRDNLKVKALLSILTNSSLESFFEWRLLHDSHERWALYGPVMRRRMRGLDRDHNLFGWLDDSGDSGIGLAPVMDARYRMVDYILSCVDKLSMAVALEVRVPFLDHRLVELMVAVPPGHKISKGHGKLLLREAASGLVPRQIVQRRKKPFGAPSSAWMIPLCNRYLRQSALVADGLLDDHALQEAEQRLSGRQVNPEKLWSLLTLEIWYRIFICRESAILDQVANYEMRPDEDSAIKKEHVG